MATRDKQRERYEREIEAARPRMLARAKRKLQADEAEDAVQDAILVALSKADWREVESPEKWACGVLERMVLCHRAGRKGKTHKTFTALDEAHEIEYGAETWLADPAAVTGDDIINLLAHAQEVADQMAEIARLAHTAGLNERERYVLLARLQEESYGEIASQLSIGQNAARAYHSQAVARIRAAGAPKLCCGRRSGINQGEANDGGDQNAGY
jgi:RNA polymerase sigma factor (sigma-70 family)